MAISETLNQRIRARFQDDAESEISASDKTDETSNTSSGPEDGSEYSSDANSASGADEDDIVSLQYYPPFPQHSGGRPKVLEITIY
jgi:hypothetical protein